MSKYQKKQIQQLENVVAKEITKPIVKEIREEKNGTRVSKEKYLAAIDPYFLTLADPFLPTTAHIPDLEHYPSATVHVVQRYECTVNAQGVVGMVFGVSGLSSHSNFASLVPIRSISAGSPIPSAGFAGGPIGLTLSSSASPSNIFAGASYPSCAYLENFKWVPVGAGGTLQPVGIPIDFRRVRLVSAGCTLEYAGTNFDNKGTLTGVFAPPGTVGDLAAATTIGVAEV